MPSTQVVFVHGDAGIGKTQFATRFIEFATAAANAHGERWQVYRAATGNPLDDWRGEEVLLLDDLRASAMDANDWLLPLDPYNASPAKARYKNKGEVAPRLIVITAIIEPVEFFFYARQKGNVDEALDQFIRRLASVVKVFLCEPGASGCSVPREGRRRHHRSAAEVVVVSYTATFDASHKVKRTGAHVRNFERHIGRDVDQAAGFHFQQRNPNIEPARTAMNETMVNDGNGGWRRPVVTQDADGKDRAPSAEFSDYLEARVQTVKRKIRTDAVVMRPLILQLDPKWFEEHNSDWREHGLSAAARSHMNAQLAWAAEEFGHQNLVGYSLHLDETSPQLQLMFTPITDDGRLAQKDYFKGPRDLQRQHKQYRTALQDSGFDVDFSVSSRSTEHLSSREYAAEADRLREMADRIVHDDEKLNEWDAALRAQQHEAEDRTAELEQRQGELDASLAEMLPLRRQAVEDGRAEGHEEGRRTGVAEGYRKGLEEGLAAAQLRSDAAMQAITARAKAMTPKLVDDFLDRQDSKGRSYRPIFERYVHMRLKALEKELGVQGELELEPGDREAFIADGGTGLTAEVRQLQRDRQIGD